MNVFTWFIVSAFFVLGATDICHHSKIGVIWRQFWTAVKDVPLLKHASKAALCPYCLSKWWGFFSMSIVAFYILPVVLALGVTFVGGIAAGRLANLLNDFFSYLDRTPNFNENAASAIMAEELSDIEEISGPAVTETDYLKES